MVRKCMKGSQQHRSLVIRHLQIKAHSMPFQPTKLANTEKSDNSKCWQGCKNKHLSPWPVGEKVVPTAPQAGPRAQPRESQARTHCLGDIECPRAVRRTTCDTSITDALQWKRWTPEVRTRRVLAEQEQVTEKSPAILSTERPVDQPDPVETCVRVLEWLHPKETKEGRQGLRSCGSGCADTP